ncbi:MAG: hypothetical protein PUG60_05600 [Lachnospiraceae bacterium]|nr:hypothetical protein [Lachnospiraceae bacterium]MDY4969688.1 hypothetical protein [Lachnospiraceae bacterium]
MEDQEIIALFGSRSEQFLNSLSQPDRVMFMKRYWFAESVPEANVKNG